MGFLKDWRQPIQTASGRVETKWPFDVHDDLTGAYTTVSGSLASLLALGQAGAQAYEFIYSSQSSVYTVVEFLATQVAAIDIKVYRRNSDDDRVEVRTGPLFDLLQEPVPGMTYADWMHRWVADRCIFGNTYLRKVGTGASRALVPLPPPRVQVIGGNVINATRYEFSTGRETEKIPAEQIIHSRRYNPSDPRIGVSALEPLRVVLRSDAAALAHMENIWRNGARAGGWLMLPDELSDDAATRLRESLQAAYSGSRNSGKVGILEGGASFTPEAWDPKESQFIEGRKLTLETVARAFNVPLPVLSLTDTATYASQQEFHKQLYVDTLGPWFKTIEGEIEAFVIPWLGEPENTYVEFNVEEKLRGSFTEQVVAVNKAVGGVAWLGVNEVRPWFGKPRIDDEDYDLPVKPKNVEQGGQQGEAPPGEDDRETGAGIPDRLRALPGGNT